MNALLPPLLLLLWSGIAATLLALLVVAPLLGEDLAALSLAPNRPGMSQSILLGLLVLPLAYGLFFQLIGQATSFTGLLAGAMHAAVLALRSYRTRRLRHNAGRLALCIIYGILLGAIFVTP